MISTQTSKFKKVEDKAKTFKEATEFGDFYNCDQETLPWVKADAQPWTQSWNDSNFEMNWIIKWAQWY